jgi:hypothetical protein
MGTIQTMASRDRGWTVLLPLVAAVLLTGFWFAGSAGRGGSGMGGVPFWPRVGLLRVPKQQDTPPFPFLHPNTTFNNISGPNGRSMSFSKICAARKVT